MSKLRIFSSTIASLLAFQIALSPVLARLPETPAESKIKISLLALDRNPKTTRTLQTLRAELQRDSKLQIVDVATPPALLSSADSATQAASTVDFREALRQSEELYRDFTFAKAVAVLQKALTDYEALPVAPEGLLPFSQIYAGMGNIYLADQNTAKAQEAFNLALQYDPQYTISEREYPPSTVKLFEQTRQEFLAKARYARLEIQSDPKAQVYLNGAPRGETPLKIDRQPVGVQWVVLSKPGYKPEKLKLDLTSSNLKRKINLAQASQGLDSLGGISPEAQRTRDLSAWGQANGLDHVVTVQVSPVDRAMIQSVEVAKRVSTTHASRDLAGLSRELRSTSQQMAGFFEKVSVAKTADAGTPAAPPSKKEPGEKKKSLFKKPWIWAVLGAVVAGGAASAFLIGGGGDGGEGSIKTSVRGSSSATP